MRVSDTLFDFGGKKCVIVETTQTAPDDSAAARVVRGMVVAARTRWRDLERRWVFLSRANIFRK